MLVVAGLIAARVFWSKRRGADGADPYRPPEWWPFDLTTWRALIRSGPAGAIEAVLVGVRYLVSLLVRLTAGADHCECSGSRDV